jgi:hypothetical protein
VLHEKVKGSIDHMGQVRLHFFQRVVMVILCVVMSAMLIDDCDGTVRAGTVSIGCTAAETTRERGGEQRSVDALHVRLFHRTLTHSHRTHTHTHTHTTGLLFVLILIRLTIYAAAATVAQYYGTST